METLFVSTLFLFVVVSASPVITFPETNGIVENTISQRIDNFNIQIADTYLQRFWSNDEYFRPGGAMIILVGSNEHADSFPLRNSILTNLAQTTNGYLYHLEHRFYGRSYPTTNLTTDNLRLLTPDQALADLAHFIAHVKSADAKLEHSPVLLVGRGYGGSLAVWFRQKYPHLVRGVWAVGAPVLARYNNVEFLELAAQTFRGLTDGDDKQCYNILEAGMQELSRIARAGNFSQLNQMFNVCEKFEWNTHNDVFLVMSRVTNVLSYHATVDYHISALCRILVDESHSTPLAAVMATINQYYSGIEDHCLPVSYKAYIADYDSEDFTVFGMRQQMYQSCTQMGWFRTTDSTNQPFGSLNPLQFFVNMCTDIFGPTVNEAAAEEAIARHNVIHGGLQPQVTNALFTYGHADSARSLSVRQVLGTDTVVVEVPDATWAEFNQPHPTDSLALSEIKQKIIVIVSSWA